MKAPNPVKLENMEGPSSGGVGGGTGGGFDGCGCLVAFVLIAIIWMALHLPGWEFIRWLFILK